MLSSAYYMQQHTLHWSLAKKYEKWIEYLTPLKNGLDNNFRDDVRRVNAKVDDLMDHLKNGVRMNDAYTGHADELEDKKEHNSDTDENLSSAVASLGNEISALQTKKANEERLADEAYQNYLAALEEERRAAEEALAKAQSVLNV